MRSDTIKRGADRAAHRRRLRATGLFRTHADFDKPFVAVCTGPAGTAPCGVHTRELTVEVQEALVAAGAVPFEFGLPSVDTAIAGGHDGSRYALPSRELVADAVESVASAHCVDALVCVAGADEIIAGALMGAARGDLPMIVLPVPSVRPHPMITSAESVEGVAEAAERRMARACEAMGVAPPGSATVGARTSELHAIVHAAAREIVRGAVAGAGVRRILTADAMDNALAFDAATGVSPTTILHLLALAAHAGIDYPLARAERVAARVPRLVRLAPLCDGAHRWAQHDLHLAGGVPAVLRELAGCSGVLALDARTVTGQRIADVVRYARNQDHRCVRPFSAPHAPGGALRALSGSLAPDGAVMLVPTTQLAPVLEGPARVFDREDAAATALSDGAIGSAEILVLRYEGPASGTGMRELTHLADALRTAPRCPTAVVTDGRGPPDNCVTFVSQVTPEAARGGPIALVRSGDVVRIAREERTLDLSVAHDELDRRRADWRAPPSAHRGWLDRYARLVGPASAGAVLK